MNISNSAYGANDDDFNAVNDSRSDENEDDDFFTISKPSSWWECITMIFTQSEERLLMLQNPDGLLYLTFLKQSGILFFTLSILSTCGLVVFFNFSESN